MTAVRQRLRPKGLRALWKPDQGLRTLDPRQAFQPAPTKGGDPWNPVKGRALGEW